MRLFRRSPSRGFELTALAAGLLVLVSALSNPLSQLFRIGSAPSHGVALLGAVVMAAALLDRWRPMRFVVRLTALGAAVGWIAGGLYGQIPPAGAALVGGAWAGIFVILGLRPVREWFSRPRSEWGMEATPEPAMQLPPLPAEKVEAAVPDLRAQRAPAGSTVRDERSKRSPDERKE